MQDLRVRAETYRERATEIRVLAEADMAHETHDALMKIATDYERLATSLDAIAASKDVLSGD
jgi:hypothetical protein